MNNIHHSLESLALDIDKLSFLEGNPRKGDIEAVAKSYKQFGQRKPIVATKDYVVIAGNHQLAAARQLGWDKIAVVITDDDELTAKAFALADNRTAELGSYDDDLLADLLSEVSSVPELMDSTGFSEDDLFDLIGFDDEPEEEQEIEVPVEPKTKLGDMYKLGNHYLLCGDATNENDVKNLIQDNNIDLLFTDPPYGIDVVEKNSIGGDKPFGAKKGNKNIIKANDYREIIGDNTTETAEKNYFITKKYTKNQIIFGGNYFTEFLYSSSCWIVWDKENTGNFADVELAWTSFNKSAKLYKWLWNGLSRKGSRDIESKKRLHPTQKPVGLFINIIKDLDNVNTILDCFAGSGSTLIACEKLNIKSYLMELDPAYCDVIIERWENLTGQKAELING